ncbi:MAG: glycerol kinase GlpK [Fimbriimonas sp.]
MSRYILALDQGTTSSRAILFDREGTPQAVAQRELPQSYPTPGWVEHDPEVIWGTQIAAAREVLRTVDVAEVAAIGITNQRETTLLWERQTGAPVHPAIVWQDRRTAEACAALPEETIRAKTGLIADAYFSATKLRWLLDHVPHLDPERLAFGTVDSFLLWRLTGGAVHATDVTNASRTLLFDIHEGRWSPDLLDLFQIPASVLPEVVPSSGIVGHTTPDLFGRPLPIAGIAGDQQAACFGQACFRPGMVKSTYGTGCFLLAPTGAEARQSANRLLTTLTATPGGHREYALEGSVFAAGAAVQWLRDELGIIARADEIDALAASVPDTAGVHVVPAFAGLGAPYWDPYARGAILGLTRGAGRAHIARATLQSIAFQCRDVLDAMARDRGAPFEEIRVDGGAAANDLLMQMQAEILGIPVVRPRVTETTALGAAYLAGLATGFWSSPEEIESLWKRDRTFTPAWSPEIRENAYTGWCQAVQRVR